MHRSSTRNKIQTAQERDKKFIDELEKNDRRTGRTTRLADGCIQTLFSTGKCYVRDHYRESHSGDENLLSIVISRLAVEHRLSVRKRREGNQAYVLLESVLGGGFMLQLIR